jgi:HD-like signal output (HDOD) protein
LANKSLTGVIKELVDADRVRLPVNPGISREFSACLAEQDPEAQQLWTLVGRDPALLCNLFRSANSSLFDGLPKTISIEEAVTRLGSSKAAKVIERACHEGEGGPRGKLLPRYMPSLWQHAQGCAVGAKWLAVRSGFQGLADQACLAGLLHDIGKQFLLAAMEEVSSSGEFNMPLSEHLIQEVMLTMHVEQGLRLFDDWNLPETFRQVVADHHTEELEAQNVVVVLVRLANKGCRKLGLGLEKNPDIVLPTTAEAQFLGISEIALAEFEIMLEDRFLSEP